MYSCKSKNSSALRYSQPAAAPMMAIRACVAGSVRYVILFENSFSKYVIFLKIRYVILSFRYPYQPGGRVAIGVSSREYRISYWSRTVLSDRVQTFALVFNVIVPTVPGIWKYVPILYHGKDYGRVRMMGSPRGRVAPLLDLTTRT